MAKKLLVYINMFSLDQDIFETTDDTTAIQRVASVPIDIISETLYSFVNTTSNIDEIEIDGNQDYIQKIGYEVLDKLKQFYSNNEVRIKLNGEILN